MTNITWCAVLAKRARGGTLLTNINHGFAERLLTNTTFRVRARRYHTGVSWLTNIVTWLTKRPTFRGRVPADKHQVRYGVPPTSCVAEYLLTNIKSRLDVRGQQRHDQPRWQRHDQPRWPFVARWVGSKSKACIVCGRVSADKHQVPSGRVWLTKRPTTGCQRG